PISPLSLHDALPIYLHHQLFVVGHLAETSRFDRVVDLTHGRVDAVHRNVADGQVFIVVAVGSHVAAAVFGAHLDLQLATFANGGDRKSTRLNSSHVK